MAGVSAQALTLLLVLSPGFIFFLGTYLAKPLYPVRVDIQRSLIFDTALYVVVSALLHATVGLSILWLSSYYPDCAISESLAREAHLIRQFPKHFCGIRADLTFIVFYSGTLWGAAFFLGLKFALFSMTRASTFQAIYGPYLEISGDPRPTYVIADVMTKTEHDGKILAYEGQLIELSLNGSRNINFVCLEGASRFYMTLSPQVSRTTPRHMFEQIDRNSRFRSRITIPGSEITNFLTRTYVDVPFPNPQINSSRSWLSFLQHIWNRIIFWPDSD